MAKRHLSIRIDADDLDSIDGLAHEHRLTRTEFMVRASLGRLQTAVGVEARFAEIFERLERAEAALFT
jgi:uncharacterized protein (DUF1778 family)